MKYCLILSVLLNILSAISTNYIDFELDGKMNTEVKLNFSIFIKKFKGLILYGVDQNNKLLINAAEKFKDKILYIHFNNFSASEKCRNLCGIKDCSNNYMSFVLELNKPLVKIKCNGYSTLLALERINNKDMSNKFYGYPLATEFSKTYNKTNFWIGNIGPYIGRDFMEYYALKNQLIGCLDRIYDNNQLIRMKKKRNKFFSTCTNMYNETICKKGHCDKKSISYAVSDCSIFTLNMKYCTRALYPYVGNDTVIVPQIKRAKSIPFRLNWIPDTSKNMCLLEIHLRNKSSILFHTTDLNILWKNVHINENKYDSIKSLGKLTNNITNSLVIQCSPTEIIIKFSDGRNIYTLLEDINSEPELINVGKSKRRNICTPFIGLLDIQYNSTEMKKLIVEKAIINQTFSKIKNWEEVVKISATKLISGGVVVATIFIFFLVLFYVIVRREIKSHFPKERQKSHFSLTAIGKNLHDSNDFRHENAINIYDRDSTYTTIPEADGNEIIEE